jgi:hypothetical protein
MAIRRIGQSGKTQMQTLSQSLDRILLQRNQRMSSVPVDTFHVMDRE